MNRILLFIPVCFVSSVLVAQDNFAFPGFTGVMRTPTAEISTKGIKYQFNNYKDIKTDEQNTYNHTFVVGLSSNFEIGGRLTDWYKDDRISSPYRTKSGKRDLSGNFKLKIPKLHPSFPDLSIGMTDFAGLATNFETKYAVATKELGKFQFSLGYSRATIGNSGVATALNGSFANMSFDLSPNISFMADYVSRDIGIGAKVKVGVLDKFLVSLQASGVRDSNKQWDRSLALTLSLPLSSKNNINSDVVRKGYKLVAEKRNIKNFISKLKTLGFSGVRVGKQNGTDVVAFENHLYNHSYIDSLSVVFSHAFKYLNNNGNIKVVSLKQNIPLLVVQINTLDFSNYINSPERKTFKEFKKSTKSWFPKPNLINKVRWVNINNSGDRRPVVLRLQPSIVAAAGTEWATLDYSLGVQADLRIPLSDGLSLNTTATLPIRHTRNYDDAGVFGSQRIHSKVNQVSLSKIIRPHSQLSLQGGLGYLSETDADFVSGQAAALWQPGMGKSQVGARVTYMKSTDSKFDDETIALATYFYNLNRLNSRASLTYGQFAKKNTGITAALSRIIGGTDTEITAYLKIIASDDMSGGLQVTMPLTPRKDKKIGNLVVGGSPYWSYAAETTIKDPFDKARNTLRFNMLDAPGFNYSLGDDLHDRHRMSPDNFLNNLKRVKESTIALLITDPS